MFWFMIQYVFKQNTFPVMLKVLCAKADHAMTVRCPTAILAKVDYICEFAFQYVGISHSLDMGAQPR